MSSFYSEVMCDRHFCMAGKIADLSFHFVAAKSRIRLITASAMELIIRQIRCGHKWTPTPRTCGIQLSINFSLIKTAVAEGEGAAVRQQGQQLIGNKTKIQFLRKRTPTFSSLLHALRTETIDTPCNNFCATLSPHLAACSASTLPTLYICTILYTSFASMR